MNLAVLLAATLSASSGADGAEPMKTKTIAFEGRPIALEAPASDKAAQAPELVVMEYPEQPPLSATIDENGEPRLRHRETDEQEAPR